MQKLSDVQPPHAGKISARGILCKMLSNINHNSWNCHIYNGAVAIHENAEFSAIFCHIIILFQSRLISYNMGEKLTKFCNFAKWQRLAVFMVNLWVLFDTRWAFTFNTSRNRIIDMWWLRNSENQFLIFGICVAETTP